MTKKDKAALIEGLNRLSADIAELAALLSGGTPAKAAEAETADGLPREPETEPADGIPGKPAEKPKECTYEEARAVLAEKARSGYRAEVKAILSAHGLKQLSEAKGSDEFAAIIAEAEVIGNA